MNNQNKQVEPYSFLKAALIVVALSIFDTFGCVVLLIGGFIFSKKGHTGLAIALAAANFIVPDALPVIDELFTVVAVVIPIYQNYKAGKSLGESVSSGINSYNEYNSDKEKMNFNSARNTITQNDDYDC